MYIIFVLHYVQIIIELMVILNWNNEKIKYTKLF